MSLNRQIAIVRYAAIPLPGQSRSFSLPLRVLAAAASPSDLSAIDIESERRSVDQAMAKLAGRQRVKVQWLMNPSWKDVQTAVWKEYPHVFYFVGHGDYDPRRYPEGVIALVNPDDGTKLPVSASDLARLVNDYALRLVVLNSCKGARGDRKSLFSSSAGKLVRSGVPAVLAMQFPVTEPAGAEFSSAFYRCLAAEDPIESALAEARLAMKGAYADSLEFGSPVLYMRSKDGRLFMVRRNFPRLRRSSRPPEDAAHVPAERSKSQRPTQNPLERGLVRGGVVKPALGRMALDCSELLGMQPRQVRASIFFLGVDGALRMSRPLSHNMHREQEFSLRIKPGQGVTGECFQTGRPLLTRFVNTPDPHATLGPQKADVHPDLKWIISVPLPTEDPAVVVSLDGLMPDGTVPTQRELKRALAGLANWIGLITREVGVVLSRRNEGGQNAKRARTVTRRKRGGGHSAKR